MKRLATVALTLAVALPACAQRRGGGGHASFAARSAPIARPAPVFRGSFASPRANFAPPMPMRYNRSALAPGAHYPVAAPLMRPTFYRHGPAIATTHRYRTRGYPVAAYPYSSSVVGYLPPDLLDNAYDDFDTYQQPALQSDQGYYPQAVPQPAYDYPQPAPPPEYGYAYPQPQPEPRPSSVAPAPADTLTLIFKDGRPPQQIQNYLATNTTLTVIDGNRHHDIPIAELDVPATIKANRDTGVGFQLPSSQ